MDELVGLLSQESEKQTLRSTCQMSIETSLTQSSIMRIIHCNAGLKNLFRLPKGLFSTVFRFSYIYISQGSVATQLRRGGKFNNHVIANCPQNVPVK